MSAGRRAGDASERIHLLISAGRGPLECAWAVAALVPRMEREAARAGLVCRRVQITPGERPGTLRSVLVLIAGAGAGDFAASWSGTLCWQAPSPYRASTGRKNWYVVAQSCDLDVLQTRFEESDVDIVPCRTGGPGGQHRNKVSTAVRATHRPTGIVVVVDTERQFGQNRRLALLRLRQRVERGNQIADSAATTARWRIHDAVVRGNPTRTERPEPSVS